MSSPVPTDRTERGSTRRLWWSAFAVLSLLTVLWSLAMPLFASPDEQAHTLRSASLARGHLLGEKVEGTELPLTRAPAPISLQIGGVTCFAFHPEVTGDCQDPEMDDVGDQPADSYTGHYQPTYSLPVGLAGRVLGDRYEAVLQRFGSALLGSALLASALVSLRAWRGGPVAAAFLLALTPEMLFLVGTVNPNGFESAAALALWATVLPLLSRPSEVSRRLVVRAAVAGTLLVLTRPLSPLWLALIVLTIAVATPWPAVWASVRHRGVQLAALPVVLGGFATVGWVLWADSLRLVPAATPDRPATLIAAVQGSLPAKIEQMPSLVGNFGWLDNPVPDTIAMFWLVALTLLVCAAVALGVARRSFATVVCLGLVLAVPVLLEASQAREIGFIWQGRYILPVFVGVPLLAAWALEHWGPTSWRRRLELGVIVLALAGHLWALADGMARYTVGEGNGLGLVDQVWSPPLPPLVLLALHALGLAALGALLLRGASPWRSTSELVDRSDAEHGDALLV